MDTIFQFYIPTNPYVILFISHKISQIFTEKNDINLEFQLFLLGCLTTYSLIFDYKQHKFTLIIEKKHRNYRRNDSNENL